METGVMIDKVSSKSLEILSSGTKKVKKKKDVTMQV